jgi:hypothetical protein
VTSWRETTKDVLPKVRDLRPTMISSPPPPSFHSLSKSVDEKDSYDSEASVNRVGYGFGRQGEKAAANRGLSSASLPLMRSVNHGHGFDRIFDYSTR